MEYILSSLLVLVLTATGFPTSRGMRKQTLALLLSFAAQLTDALQNPKDNFCRRYAHQATVIDDKLYIDGGYVNFDSFAQDHRDVPNTWLGYHDLNNLTTGTDSGWPQLDISLKKDSNFVPTVAGGILWGDDVNKKFVVYGGESTQGVPEAYHIFSYDILQNSWADLGVPTTPVPPNISAYGAGVSLSQLGQGYYYGGWISNKSMRGWTQPPTMSSNIYKYDYDANKLSAVNPPDKLGRAEGAMTWIPAGDNGLLVYFGGMVDPGNGTKTPQPMDKILIYDPQTNAWFKQTATGEIPQNRAQFCMDTAWAPDRSSYNIYIWGGLSVAPPVVNVTAFNDVYVLTLPTFQWAKIFPGHHGNATYAHGHYSATCNMVKSRSQMMVIGGTYPDSDECDLASNIWALHNIWTGGVNNTGKPPDDVYWANYNPNVSSNVVPVDVFSLVGGDKNGGATLLTPKGGFDQDNTGTGLAALLLRKPTFQNRTATRSIACTQSCQPTSSPTSTTSVTSSKSSRLSTGAIVGVVIAGVVVLGLLICGWLLISKRIRQRRQPQQQPQMAPAPMHPSPYSVPVSGATSPYPYQGPWPVPPENYHQSVSPPMPPSELAAHQPGKVGEFQQTSPLDYPTRYSFATPPTKSPAAEM